MIYAVDSATHPINNWDQINNYIGDKSHQNRTRFTCAIFKLQLDCDKQRIELARDQTDLKRAEVKAAKLCVENFTYITTFLALSWILSWEKIGIPPLERFVYGFTNFPKLVFTFLCFRETNMILIDEINSYQES